MKGSWFATLMVVGIAVIVPSTSVAAPAETPTDLLHAVLTTPFVKQNLPAGATSPRATSESPTANERKHHVVGTVQIYFDGAGYASIIYEVFPSRADAVGDYESSPGVQGDVTAVGPPSLPQPSETINSPSVKISGVRYVDGNVLVFTDAQSATPSEYGGLRLALKLARLADAHLAALRAKG